MDFYGRAAELEALEASYAEDKFSFYVVYGRRRIGKTTLLHKFIEHKPALYFSAQEANEALNLNKFSQELYRLNNIKAELPAFSSWDAAFSYLTEIIKEQRLVLVIDEFPYIAAADKSILSLLQHNIDLYWKDTNLFLILCGSSMSFMQNEVLSYKSPLFGRRTAQIHLKPFGFYESCELLSAVSDEEKIQYYAILGGIPQYLEKVDQRQSLKANLLQLFFQTSAYLYDEPQMLMKQELREPAVYNSIVTAIANGKTKINEICDFTKETSSKVSKYIANLIEMGIVRKEVPFKENAELSKKGIYRLEDAMFQFWFRFVFENRDLIEMKQSEFLYDVLVKEHLSEFVSFPFEKICMEFLLKKSAKKELPFQIIRFGKWWGNDSIEKQQVEIDIVCEGLNTLLIGECKWQNEVMNMGMLEKVKSRAHLFPKYDEVYIALFSKAGFNADVIQAAKVDRHILLYTMEDLFIGEI